MADYKGYSPAKVSVMFGAPGAPGTSHRVRGFGTDSMVEVAFDSDFGSVVKSVDGLNRHVDMLDRSGTITITLGQHSESNAIFSALVAANVPVPVTIIDKSSVADLFSATSVKIKTHPGMAKSATPGDVVWVWQFTRGTVALTGSFE